MTRVYIAAPLPHLHDARAVARELSACTVVSTWHVDEPTVAIEREMSDEQLAALGSRCLREVASADVLLLLCGGPTTRHGSILEAGYALGAGIPVVAHLLTPSSELPTRLLCIPEVLRFSDRAALPQVVTAWSGLLAGRRS